MKRLLTAVDYCGCFIAFLSVLQAIPIQRNGTDFSKAANNTHPENVCVHENAIYAEGENFSTSNPCEVCVCDPPGISCSLSSCDLKPGCKAIHRANQCCPEYVCECERNGRIYGNGEKVEEPNPCKVCYCKGGEIKCALVTCYTRDDCEPGYVAGVCCPKYDHCPPLEMMKNKSTTTAPAEVIISDLKTESTPILLQENIKDAAPIAEHEATELTTSEGYSNTASTTEDGTTLFEPLSTEFSEIFSYTTEFPSTTFPETTEDYSVSTEFDRTTELSNETSEASTIAAESTTEFYTTPYESTDSDTFVTDEYNATDAEVFTTTSEEISTNWTEEFSNETEEYLSTEPVYITEGTTIDPRVRPEAVKDITSATTVEDQQATYDFFSTPLYESTTMPTEYASTDSVSISSPTEFEELETVDAWSAITEEPREEELTEEELREVQLKEKESSEEELKEKDPREKESTEEVLKEKESAEKEPTEEKLGEEGLREVELKEKEPTEKESTEEELSEEGLREVELKEKESTEEELSEEGLREVELKEKEPTEKESTEEELKGKELREEEPTEEELKEKDPREKESTEEELKGKEPTEEELKEKKLKEEKPTEEISKDTVVKVIVPKTMKETSDQIQNSADGREPIIVMISAEQIQFLKLAEDPPEYVEKPDSGDQKPEHGQWGVIIVPKTTPTTVEMVKVVDGSVNARTEAAKSVNNSIRFNRTDIIEER